MVFPVDFGWLQALIAVLFVIGVVLVLTALLKARKVGWHALIGRGTSALAVLLVAVVILWITTLLQSFLGLTGEVKAAHLVAKPVANDPHTLMVELTLFGDEEHPEQRATYQVEGDMWVLQANIVELEPWVNALGFHSGYKVTRLYGQRLDGVAVKQNQIFLNGSDQDFFEDMRDQTWYTKPFVRSAYGNAVIAVPGSYDVFISRDAIKTRPA
ncbi:hypothetical protein NDR87_28280 [Nocardia sp. CDC159]|uniref:Uncharacterized protein n=1 Tax=Nocardia pulmonis TaxID=2951408 RepID=A0A9X2EFP7_9NOCA|nr:MULTISPECIES: hypothetical protein [Nocardia]MCM6777391.1 hypothetical protein [Nocardia pulmonis]MCM6790276.1 hypothetical protein [Nocardia sp. CDC159]